MRKNRFLEVIKVLFIVAIPGLTLFLSIYFYNRVTDGFNVRQITSSISPELFLPTPKIDVAKKKEIETILSQPFHYLGKGCQFYAFESNCGKYVLKIIKQKHLRDQHGWLSNLPLPQFWLKKLEKRQEKKREHTKAIFDAYSLAFHEFSEGSGLILYHFNHDPFLGSHITLIDRLGLANPIYLDDFEFVLQKRGQLIKEVFPKLIEDNDVAAIREKIEALKLALIERMQKGLGDRDRSFVQNIAFSTTDNRAIFIDVGQLYKEERIKTEEEGRKEIFRRLNNFRSWAEDHIPELVAYIDEELSSEEK